MRPSRSLDRVLVALFALGTAAASPLHAQLIGPRTIPIAQGDQFNIFPAANRGLGGVTIALDDSLGDPWSNPARITRLRSAHFFSAPTFYSISDGGGAGRTLPMGAAGGSGAWSGGLIAAIQQVDKGQRQFYTPEAVSDRSAINQFVSAVVGRTFERRGLSLGGSLSGGSIHAVDGVDLLYGNAQKVDQSGSLFDARMGLTRTWADSRALDVVLVYDRYNMTHDAKTTTWFYPPYLPTPKDSTPINYMPISRDSVAHNEDRTVTWGAHAKYSLPLTATGWRAGWTATFNKLEHPKIPNYDVSNLPRDPGSTRAFNFGAGLSRVRAQSTFGVDVIYEPMWSTTWATAARDTAITGGGVIRAGGKTVENDFTFSNTLVRVGIGRVTALGTAADPWTLGLQAGVSMYAINYHLRQLDDVRRTDRSQNEDWVEWTPSLGISLHFTDLEIRYTGSYLTGVDRPGANYPIAYAVAASPGDTRGGTIIAAPSSPLVMSPVHVVTHQLSFSLPIR